MRARLPPSGASGTRSRTMLRSLRTRLALLFAGTLLVATVISGAASVRLYQSYNRDQTEKELTGQVAGVAQYYQRAFRENFQGGTSTSRVSARRFEQITGRQVYYATD